MEIDLSKVIYYSSDSLQSRDRLRSIMLVLYPGKTREMNLLLDVYESGVPRKIRYNGHVTEAEYGQYIREIVDDYGIDEPRAKEGLDAWIKVCLGQERTQETNQPVSVPESANPADYVITPLGYGEVEISKYVGFDQEYTVVPAVIGGVKVKGIGIDAYKNCKEMKKLLVSEGIEYISEGAFAGCINLNEVHLPNSLRTIGRIAGRIQNRPAYERNGAFQQSGITEIILPNDIRVIDLATFYFCYELKRVVLPCNLRIIGEAAFNYCKSLEEIVLPASVIEVKKAAFRSCEKLSKVILNEGLKRIEEDAFAETKALYYLAIPRSVTEFEKDVFTSESVRCFCNFDLTVGCYAGSRALEYARANNLKIKPLQEVPKTDSQAFEAALSKASPITYSPTVPAMQPVDLKEITGVFSDDGVKKEEKLPEPGTRAEAPVKPAGNVPEEIRRAVKKCPNCGAQIIGYKDGIGECPYCGTKDNL